MYVHFPFNEISSKPVEKINKASVRLIEFNFRAKLIICVVKLEAGLDGNSFIFI